MGMEGDFEQLGISYQLKIMVVSWLQHLVFH
jgi:hypothetical protein